ncbi:MAG: MFS transporter [Planctomycetaceae bacterium]|nr:MFS transporter [Planctomycetaceae bacterium]
MKSNSDSVKTASDSGTEGESSSGTGATIDSDGKSLWTPGFVGLLLTQWLTAINDNVFRWLAIDIAKDFLPTNHTLALMLGSIGFVAPFLVFAAPAGFLADRFPKRTVIVVCKYLEIVAMTIGLLAIWYSQFYLLVVTVFLMGAQTALFSPAKLGIIPEMMSSRRISAANGWMGLATMTATVIGMFIGGFLKDNTGYLGIEQNFWMSAVVLLGLAVVGTGFSLLIPKLKAAAPETKFSLGLVLSWVTMRQAYVDLRELFQRRLLFYASIGSVFFWAVAGVAQLDIDVLSAESGGVLASDRTPLLICLVLGVALGNVLAGILSRGKIELGLVPIGCGLIVLFAVLLSLCPADFYLDQGPWRDTLGSDATWSLVWACVLLFGLGIGSGLYDVPLTAYLQYRAPASSRGAIIAANNFMVFATMMLGFVGFNLVRTKVSPGELSNIPVVAQWRSESKQNVLQEERIQERIGNWTRLWSEKVRSDAAALEKATKQLESEPSIENLFRFRELTKELASKRPEIGVLIDNVPANDERREYLVQGMWAELTQRGMNEFSPVRDQPKLEIDRTSFGRAYDLSQDARWGQPASRLAAQVFDQSLHQPLLSGRQVFLLIAVLTTIVFGIVVYHLGHHTTRFIRRGQPQQRAAVTWVGGQHLPNSPAVFLLFNSSPSVIAALLEGAGRTMSLVVWRGSRPEDFLSESSHDEPLTVEPTVRVFNDARKVDSRPLIRLLEEGSSVVIPMYENRNTDLRRECPENLPVLLHECRQAGFDTLPVVAIRGTVSDRSGTTFTLGPPVNGPGNIARVVQAFEALGAHLMKPSEVEFVHPVEQFIRQCKSRGSRLKIADSMGQKMTGTEVLMRTVILCRLLKQHVLSPDETHVGLLIPPAAGAVLANAALALDGRTSVNLNYSATAEVMNQCIRQAGVKHVLTTRKIVEKLNVQLEAPFVFLDDLREKVGLWDKLAGALAAYLKSANGLVREYKIKERSLDEVLTVIFTSGSTGLPKGVMLTSRNIACVIEGVNDAVVLNSSDVILGVLPFFHSFGFAVPLWTVLGTDIAGVYHFNPLDAPQIGKLCQQYKATILLATPTFLRSYMKRVSKEDFATLDVVVAGAEKLPTELSDAFETKYGVRPVEGYGTTELAPLVSVNQPAHRVATGKKAKVREGSVGAPVVHVRVKTLDLDTGKETGVGEPGMLWVAGPNVMKGYMKRPDLTAESIVDGWYNTGDVAYVDSDGFIHITGRLSRFSKIGGEMVPHILIEQKLNEIVCEEKGDMKCAVSSVPDEKKGERLIVLHTAFAMSVDDLRDKLIKSGLPSLYVPSGNSFFQVDELPMLGSGKLDLKQLKDTAKAKAAAG